LIMGFTTSYPLSNDLPKILCTLLPMKFLPACLMVNSICLVIPDNIPLPITILNPLNQYAANIRHHPPIPRIRPSGSFTIPDMSWFSVNHVLIDCPTKHVQITHPFAQVNRLSLLVLEIMNHLNFILGLFKCFLNSMCLPPSFLGGPSGGTSC
jgi:hypothetical protein